MDKLFQVLLDMYIRDTMVDGKKFCDCGEGDCANFGSRAECRACLKDTVERELEALEACGELDD